MKLVSKSDAQRRPKQPSQPPRTEIPSKLVYGFPVSHNQFQLLQDSQPAVSTSPNQIQDRFVNPRTTTLARLQVARRDAEQGTLETLSSEGIFDTVPLVQDVQGTLTSGGIDQPVASASRPQFFLDSLTVSPSDILNVQSGGNVYYLLETGAMSDDAMYSNDVNDVACTNEPCNKRISVAGLERSAGRPGHTPTRHELACGKHIEDRVAGQDWSAGRPGIRPFGTSTAACPSSLTACLGPYGTAHGQPHHTGPNTREERCTTSSTTRRSRHQSTIQPTTSSSRRSPAAEDRASPAMVALHLRRPPYFCGDADDDVHVWTSIVSRWLSAIQGEPSRQLTYVVSLLRGATYEWYSLMEMRTGCPGDWTTLRHAMLGRFGSSMENIGVLRQCQRALPQCPLLPQYCSNTLQWALPQCCCNTAIAAALPQYCCNTLLPQYCRNGAIAAIRCAHCSNPQCLNALPQHCGNDLLPQYCSNALGHCRLPESIRAVCSFRRAALEP